MHSFRIVDVSGLGNAGKTAVCDFLREFESVHSFHYSLEFDLIRLPHGILDLQYHLVEDWSPIRSNHALRAFQSLCEILAGSEKSKNIPALFFSSSHGYEAWFKGRFSKLAGQYVQSFIADEYKAFWPYYMIEDNPFNRAYKKVKMKLKFQKGLLNSIYLVDGSNFNEKTSKFIHDLLSVHVPENKKWLTLNNSFEPFNPKRSLEIINKSKAILVYRDPRDVYVSGLNAYKAQGKDVQLQATDNNGINKSFLGSDNLETFIKRQNLYFSKLDQSKDPRVLLVRFEDFVKNHSIWKKKIMDFLELTSSEHEKADAYFSPQKSAQNIGLWKQYSQQEEIDYIVKNLQGNWMLYNE